MPLGNEVVSRFLGFQSTGTGFDGLYGEIEPTLQSMVRGRLRRRLVKGRHGGDDEDAVDEAVQHVLCKLAELPGKDPKHHFDPTRGKGGADALAAFLFGFCDNAVRQYCSKWRHAKKSVKVLPATALDVNDAAEADSILKTAVAKVEAHHSELCDIMNACLAELPGETLRAVLRLNVWEGLSERSIADRMGISVSKAHRTLVKARSLLKEALGRRGIDESWFGEAA